MANDLKILLVEDEALIALVVVEGLQDGGFHVEYCDTGELAMAALDEDACFCAVITDIRLGEGPSGWDVARHARERSANIPILYLSGDSAADHSAYGVPDSIMIQKPFTEARILTAVASLLNARPNKSVIT